MLQVTVTNEEDGKHCPVRSILAPVMSKWQSLILLSLEDGALRFGKIKKMIGDISPRVLTENLRSLERDGYITRTVDAGPPVAVSYELTNRGITLVSKLKPLVMWAENQYGEITKSRKRYDQSQKK